jgi:hypothetical protein
MSDKQRGTVMKKATRTERYTKEPAGKRLPARAHRDDTPEASSQQRQAPKTHPTRNPGAMRKDKRTGAGVPSAATKAPKPRTPPKVRRPSRSRSR